MSSYLVTPLCKAAGFENEFFFCYVGLWQVEGGSFKNIRCILLFVYNAHVTCLHVLCGSLET